MGYERAILIYIYIYTYTYIHIHIYIYRCIYIYTCTYTGAVGLREGDPNRGPSLRPRPFESLHAAAHAAPCVAAGTRRRHSGTRPPIIAPVGRRSRRTATRSQQQCRGTGCRGLNGPRACCQGACQGVSVASAWASYLTLPYLILPYLTLPYLILPYLTLPYLTLPYLTLPYLT